MCVCAYVYMDTYIYFYSFMKDFCRVSCLETSSEAAKTAELMRNEGKLQYMSEARVGLSSELHPHSRIWGAKIVCEAVLSFF